VIAAWAADHKPERPHSALDYQTPADYARILTTAPPATLREMIAPRAGRLLNLRRSA
jgi:putative transposase